MSTPSKKRADGCPVCGKRDATPSAWLGTCPDHGWFVRRAWESEPAPHPSVVANHAGLFALWIEYTSGVEEFAFRAEATEDQRRMLVSKFAGVSLDMTPSSIKAALLEVFRAGVDHGIEAAARRVEEHCGAWNEKGHAIADEIRSLKAPSGRQSTGGES